MNPKLDKMCKACDTYPCACPKPINHKEGKDRMLILFEYFPDALPMVAEVFYKALESGKYERRTFGAVPVEELLEKLLRHIRDHRKGELINEADFNLYHSAHMVANGLMVLQNELDASE